VALAWVPTLDLAADDYEVWRGTTSGGPYASVAVVAPVTLAAAADAPPALGTWYYVVRTRAGGWESGPSNEAAAIVDALNAGPVPCTDQSALAGGDNDGYEVAPANACADDGAFARDVASGTSTALGCTAAGKDRHRFSGFGLGVPLATTAISGITVRADARVADAAGTNRLCAQLSWNGGASWTGTRLVDLTTAETSHLLGGPADSWGRTWTGAQLQDAAFQVRLFAVSNVASQDFELDHVAVTVTYVP
jgi:hypothetical protein